MKLYNRTNKTVFWTVNCLPPRMARGRLLPPPTISFEAHSNVDLSEAFSEEDLKLIRESENLPRGLTWEDDLKKVIPPKPTAVSTKDPLPSGSRSVLNKMKNSQDNVVVPEASLEEVSSEEVEEMQESLGGIGSDLELPDGDDTELPNVNVSAEEVPTKEELAEIEGRRPAQSWRRRQLWVWAYSNGLNPEDFSNKRTIWDLIKNHMDS